SSDLYFYTLAFHAITESNKLAIERGRAFAGFERSKYASGEFFTKYTEQEWVPQTERVRELFAQSGVHIPTQDDWRALAASVKEHGLYNQNLQRSEEHTSELQSRENLVCRLLLEKKNRTPITCHNRM